MHIKSVNRVFLIGRLGNDPVLRYTKNGTAVATLSLATSKSYKAKGSDEWQETTQWHKIVLWRGLAEFVAERLSKGSAVYIEGELKYRSWEDENGNNRKIAEIHATTCNLLSDGRSISAEEETSDTTDDEDIPF